MARLEDLVAQVSDQLLQQELKEALAELKQRRKFGIVFEQHIPETLLLAGLSIQPGTLVQYRKHRALKETYIVTSVSAEGYASVESVNDSHKSRKYPVTDLLVAKRFGEPIYPTLIPIESLQRGAANQPYHAVINGENFHTLELFLYLIERRVDCIYIDPPYNTGAHDWQYNNRYVDASDSWRHSKWLSFVAKRLALARRLLKPDGVCIVTVDEHEVFHLGMLLERLFPDYRRYMVTLVTNPKGTQERNFGRVDEQAMFVVPQTNMDIIQEEPLDLPTAKKKNQATFILEAQENEDAIGSRLVGDNGVDGLDEGIEWEHQLARRRGTTSSYRHQRPNEFYPIFIDESKHVVVRAGAPIPLDEEPDFSFVDGLRPIWPIDAEGRHRYWRFKTETMQNEIDAGNIVLGKYNEKNDSWTINVKRPKKTTKKLKTVWWDKSHDAGTHGTEVLKKLLGEPGLFPFPKSIYAVRDCLAAVTRNRPDALILDFFAGSGTTFHATCLLNAEDGGSRRCILVTNNEVAERDAKKLNKQGYFRGDQVFEDQGIFERVTKPRCKAVITGRRPDGSPIQGSYIEGGPFEKGFAENIEFYRLDYLDPDDIDLGRRFDSILPALWIAAGGVGTRECKAEQNEQGYSMPADSNYAVLFRESRFSRLLEALKGRPDVTHVWIVTDSQEAYAEMRAALPRDLYVSMLYRDYLRNFRININKDI
jgi:adenine-specific DNA-methyltransferase